MNDRTKYDDFEMKEEYDFSDGIRGRFYHPKKKSTTIRLDEDVILYFKKKASEKKIGYQSLVNAALREYVHDHSVEQE
jgi:uncharacterized protein (DUF4415 family)